MCLVYDRARREIFELPATAWLAFELCDGRDTDAAAGEFAAAVEPLIAPLDARRRFDEAVERLRSLGLVAPGEISRAVNS